jgi:hypothetical protein
LATPSVGASVVHVVAQGIVDEVGDQALDEAHVACIRRWQLRRVDGCDSREFIATRLPRGTRRWQSKQEGQRRGAVTSG